MAKSTNGESAAANGPVGYEAWEEPTDSRLSVLAVLSLVFSITCIGAPLGIIFGVASLFSIASSRGRRHGKGLAIAGVVVGLVFATLLTYAGVGALNLYQQINARGLKPAGEMMAALDANDLKRARVLMSPALSAEATDEAIEGFRSAYQAELGTFKSMPQSLLEWVAMLKSVGQQAQGMQGSNRPVVPIPAQFSGGTGLVLFELFIGKPEVRPGDPGCVANIGIVIKGKIQWLVDPAKLPAPGMKAPFQFQATPAPPAPPPPPAGG